MAKNKVLEKTEALKLYRKMLLIRKFEEKCTQLYGSGVIAGFCHLYIGQEAVVSGLQFVANSVDSVITSYRDHGHMLACGMDPKKVMSELTGRASGYSKGKGGSMHMFSKEKNFYGGHGIVGAQVSLGGGLALAHKYKNDGGLSMVYYGDGAANQGQIAETFNMAALWKLPALFVLENNQYSMGTSNQRSTANTDFSLRGIPYNIPSEKVDGMNVLDVIEKGKKAMAYIRAGNGPYLLEVWTYRYRGHSMSDPAKYRTREELEEVREHRDPINTFVEFVKKEQLITDAQIKEIQNEIKAIIKEAEEFALTSTEPEAKELYTDILV